MPMILGQLDKNVSKAWLFLREKMGGTLRKDGFPVADHSWRVAECLHDILDIHHPEALIAALLHDVIEFSKGSRKLMLEAVEDRFGGLVEQRVYLLTKPEGRASGAAWNIRLDRVKNCRDEVVKAIAWIDRMDGLGTMCPYLCARRDVDGLTLYISDSLKLLSALSENPRVPQRIELLKIRIDESRDMLEGLKKQVGMIG